MTQASDARASAAKLNDLDEYLLEAVGAIRLLLGPAFVGRIEINYFEGGGSVNVLRSTKFKNS
jgi:hypothetical protein